MSQPTAFCAVMRIGAAERAAAAPWARAEGVSLVRAGPLAALYAASAAQAGGAKALLGKGAARREAAAALVARQRVLERLLDHGDALPALPGAALPSAAATQALVANAPALTAALAALAGRVQHQVLIGWDPAAGLARWRDAPELAALGAAPRPGPVARAAEALRARIGGGFARRVAAAAEDAIALPLDGPERLVNLALLTGPGGLPALEAALEAVDAEWSEGLAIRLVGPTPPHSFAALAVAPPDAAAEARARAMLGLDEGAALAAEAIRKAFRARARALHPDAGGAGGDLAALATAEALLLRLAAARETLGRDGPVTLISLRREDGSDPAEGARERGERAA